MGLEKGLTRIEALCVEKGLRMTEQRRVIARVLSDAADILERHDFRDGRSRYEEVPESHHDHLIDIQSGSVIEFRNEDIERLQRRVAEELGFELVDHRLELYGVPKGSKKPR